MANYPDDLQYTTYYAQESLGDVVYVDLPKVGVKVTANEPFGSVESVKAVSELFSPVSGEVVEINEKLNDSPELVNSTPYEDGWMIVIKLSNTSEVDALLSAAEYEDFLNEK
jgi:glycine cleavage system H protein